MRTDVKIGLVCAFVIVMGAVIYFVAQPAHPAKPRNSDAQASGANASGASADPTTAPATAPGIASAGSLGGPFILPPGPSSPIAGTPAAADPAGSLSAGSGSQVPPFGAPSMNGSFAPGTLGSPASGAAAGLGGSSTASTGTLGTPSFGPAASAGPGAHAGTIDLSGSTPFGGFGSGSSVTGSSSTATTYVIQKEDMLGPIAKRFGVSVSAIIAANPGLNPNRLQINKTINIPAGTAVASGTTPTTAPAAHGTHETAAHGTAHTDAAVAATTAAAKPGNSYKIKKSDTLMTIARSAYGSEKDWKRIYQANKTEITDPNLVPVGLVIKIPQ